MFKPQPFFPPNPPPKPGQPLPIPPSGAVQYIGARYVPVFANPLEWSPELTYEPMTIVTYNNNSYTSRVPVPAGVLPTNDAYWAMTGQFNAQLADLSGKIDGWDEQIAENTETAKNAETTAQNALDLVNQSTADYQTIKATVEQHTTEIADVKSTAETNADNIASNEAAIKQNETNIATNTGDISTLKAQVKTASDSIGQLQTDVQQNTQDIQANTAAIQAGSTASAALEARVAKNETNIAANTAAIGTDSTAGTIKGRIKALESTTITTNQDLTALTGRVTNAESNIAANTADITQAKADISTVQSNITADRVRITDLEQDVSALQTDNTKNKADIAKNASDIAALQTATGGLSALEKQVDDNTAAIAVNAKAITDNDTKQTAANDALDTKITANATQISGLQSDLSDVSTTVNENTLEINSVKTQSDTASAEVARLTGIVGDENSGLIKDFNDLKESVESGESLEALAGRVGSLETNVGKPAQNETPATGLNLAVETNTADITALKSQIGQVPSDVTDRLTSLETTVGDNTSGLVKDVNDNMADISTAQADIAEIKQQQTAQDTAISGNTTAIGNVNTKADAALPKSGGTMTGDILMGTHAIHDVSTVGVKQDADYVRLIDQNFPLKPGLFGITSHIQDTTTYLKTIIGIASPVFAHDCANKAYVDNFLNINSSTVSSGYGSDTKGIWGGTIGIASGLSNAIICGAYLTESSLASNITSSVLIGCVIEVAANASLKNCTLVSCYFIMGTQNLYLRECRIINCKKSSDTPLNASLSSIYASDYNVT